MIQAEGEVYFSVFAVIIRALFALCRVVKCAGKPGNLVHLERLAGTREDSSSGGDRESSTPSTKD